MASHPAPVDRRRPRWSVLVFLLAFTAGVVVLTYWYLFPALRAFVEAHQSGDKQGARAISGTAALLLAVVLFILVCGVMLTLRMGRFFFPRNAPPRTKTTYVDAWAESGRRMRAPEGDQDERA